MRNIKIEIEYDGTDFYGWQFQPELRTIQGDIENALKVIFRNEITVIGAGRTDTGVHARGQVANFLIEDTMPVLTVKAALNGNLSKDVRIISSEEVSQSFHARYDAIKRHYSYTITKQEKAIDRHYMWCYKSALDVEQMQHASQRLLGEHDFSAFCQADENMKHYRCFMEEIRWEQNGALLILNIIANRFLHNMVRIIVGTMINVGRGFAKVEDIPQILESRDRRNAGPTIPAKGLCLEKVYYGDGDGTGGGNEIFY
ncbi:MAG TPA: tRNA pseudouridine(38-40) synthase TruA [bacterium]